jgi:3-hydroxyisobutyrate dehydrogenase-like beta-hydroxyacid dehydrogenase
MGGRMAKRLLDKGHSVTGHNRTRSKAQWLIDSGMKWADTPRQVCAAADVTFAMVSNSHALEEVSDGPEGMVAGLSAGKFLIDISTVSPAVSLKPLLLDIGPKVTHVGDNGQALVMKIATNLSLAVQMLAFSEGVLLAEKSGISREIAVDVLTHSVIGSPMVQYRGPHVLGMPDEVWFNVNMMQKDMLLALELGRQVDVPLPTTSVTNEMLTASRGMGFAEQDFAVIFHTLARMSGLTK